MSVLEFLFGLVCLVWCSTWEMFWISFERCVDGCSGSYAWWLWASLQIVDLKQMFYGVLWSMLSIVSVLIVHLIVTDRYGNSLLQILNTWCWKSQRIALSCLALARVDSVGENRKESTAISDCDSTALAGMWTNQFCEDIDFRTIGLYKIRARHLFY